METIKARLSVLLMLLVCWSAASAQELTEADIEELKPAHHQTKLILNGVPIWGEVGGANMGFGYGVNLDGFVVDRLYFNAGFTSSFGSSNENYGNDPFHSDAYQGVGKMGTSNLIAGFHLIDKIGIGRIRVEKYKGMQYTGTGMAHFYDVYKKRGPLRKIVAVRGGLYNWKSAIQSEEGWFMMPEGSGSSVPSSDRIYTDLKTSNFSLGISSGKIVAGSDMGAAGTVSYFRNLYADVLFNVSTELSPVEDSFGSSYSMQVGEGTLEETSIGWRVGWSWVGLGKKYWVGGYYFEAGSRPGIQGRGTYMQMGFILGTKYVKK